jgi:DNA polymerase I
MSKFESEDDRWAYNVEDCVRTREVGEVEAQSIQSMGLVEVEQFQQDLFWPVLWAMNRGIRIDLDARAKMAFELLHEIDKRSEYFQTVLGHPLNPGSPKQMQALFYEDFAIAPILKRTPKGMRPTCDDDALNTIKLKEPLTKGLIHAIQEQRSLKVFLSTFVSAPLDIDSRMRCSYNVCGTETYRFSSSKNAFDTGANLQNIPKGGAFDKDPDALVLPNIRSIFIPDEGMTFFDMDLDRADLQVVVWESDEDEFKSMLRAGVDMHAENAKVMGISRQLAKSWVHGTNYGGGPRTMARNCGLTIHQAETMRARWFSIHPGILAWHKRTEAQLKSKRYVENRLGYRRFYFDRIEGLLPEALAWIPQSTVACVINRAWVNTFRSLGQLGDNTCEVLLQVHDSLAGQFPTALRDQVLPRLTAAARITIPYSDPLIIPTGVKTSVSSWGACE